MKKNPGGYFVLSSFLVALILFSTVYRSSAQQGVKIAATTGSADPSAMLDVESTNKGVLVPRMTASQRTGISSPAEGLIVYQTDGTEGYWYYAGSSGPVTGWIQMGVGAISGTGTVNYLPKWATANSLSATSSIYDNGNVGIGTTSPGEAFSVYKTMSAWQGRFANSSGTGADVYLSHGGGYGMHIRGWNASDGVYTLQMYNNSVETNAFWNSGRVALGLAGNVGIGTGSPGAKLHLSNGDASFALFGPNTTWNSYLYVGAGTNTISSGRAQVISTNGNLHLDAGSTQNIYIAHYNGSNTFMQTGGGNVGIGTTAPGAKLHVEGQIKITGGSPGAGKVLTSDASGLATWEVSSAALDYGNASTGGPRPVGNFGQFQGHSTYTDFNTAPAYWGWNYVQGAANAPNSSSSQWYRGVFSLGSQYPARGSGGYSLELAFPRDNAATAGAWQRTVENGSIGGWSPIGSGATNVTALLNDHSGFPSGSYGFTTSGGTILLCVSGSGYATSARQIGVDVYVDGVWRGRARGFTNEASSHKAFTSGFIVVTGLAAGNHTMTLGNYNSTSMDANDPFNAAVIELW